MCPTMRTEARLAIHPQVVSSEGIECGFKRIDGFLVADPTDPEASLKMDRELDLAVKAGLQNVAKVRHVFSCD